MSPNKTDSPARRGYVNHNFRVEANVLDGLERVSKLRNISVNILAEKALRRMVEWEAIAERFGYMAYPSTFMAKIMSYLSEDQISDLARWNEGNLAREFNRAFLDDKGLEGVFRSLEILSIHARRFDLETSTIGEKRTVVIRHNLGPKWSLFYEEAMRCWMNNSLQPTMDDFQLERTDNQVTLTLSVPEKTPKNTEVVDS